MNNEQRLNAEMWNRWNRWNDRLHYGIIISLIAVMIILDHVSKHTAKTLVWYLCGGLMTMLIICYLVSVKAHKERMKLFEDDYQQVLDAFKKLEDMNGKANARTTFR